MRVFELDTARSPRDNGRAHGESFRGEIQSLAELRTYLTVKVGGFSGADEVMAAAKKHLPVLSYYDAGLFDELCGIADGANVTPEQIVVLNHYTDLRDLAKSGALDDDGCSVVLDRDSRVLAQTWDMHATAIPYVMMLRIPPDGDRPGAWLLSLTGCLGMAGMNTAGVAIAINNLHSTDAVVGVVWSALVRKALYADTAVGARDSILISPVGSGHHYVVADDDHAYAIETSGQRRRVIWAGQPSHYVHTNHCLDPRISEASRVPESSTTYDRYDWLSASVAARPIESVHDAWERLGSEEGYPRSVCTNMATPENPHAPATCGAIAMDFGAREVWAAAGLIHNVAPERFEL
jgi:isopenicillin-N N-acyltransferase-like protein